MNTQTAVATRPQSTKPKALEIMASRLSLDPVKMLQTLKSTVFKNASDDEVAARSRSYRNLCFKAERRFFHTELGYNFRLTNLQAAVGLAQVERLDEFLTIKARIGATRSDDFGEGTGRRRAG